MAMEFGKLNFAVGFNRTSAFPLDANSYFEDYDSAVTAAAGAAEVGSADSAYYIGQVIIVKDATKGVGLYQINAEKELIKFGQASSADELTEAVNALQARCTTIEGKLILATAEKDGFLSKEDFSKLTAIEAGAQVNKLESVKVDGAALEITEKAVNIDLAGALALYAKSADVTAALGKKVDAVEGKGLSTNDYDATAVAEVAKIKDKADASTVTELSGKVTKNTEDISTINGKLAGLTGAMHFVGTSTTDPMGESGATVENYSTFTSGDVCLFGNKEFVYNGTAWVELGDEGSHLTKTEAASTYLTKTDAERTYTTESQVQDLAQSVATQAKDDAIAEMTNMLDDYSNTTATQELIATAKSEAISEAGTAADGKITEALKAYTNTESLTSLLAAKADKSAQDATEAKATANATAIKALQDVGAEKNVIQTVSAEFAIDTERNLTVKEISKDKISGLAGALDKKVDKVEGQRLITADESTKLSKLTLGADETITIDGKIAADNVDGLGTWITTNRDTLAGLLSADNATKLEGVEAGAQVNQLESIKINGVAQSVVEKSVNIPMATGTLLGVVMANAAENGVAVATNGKMSVHSLNVNKLVQTAGDVLILDGGNASGN